MRDLFGINSDSFRRCGATGRDAGRGWGAVLGAERRSLELTAPKGRGCAVQARRGTGYACPIGPPRECSQGNLHDEAGSVADASHSGETVAACQYFVLTFAIEFARRIFASATQREALEG